MLQGNAALKRDGPLIDQPRPSRGYVIFFLCCICAIPLFLGSLLAIGYAAEGIAAPMIVASITFALLSIICTFIFAGALHTGYHIRYELNKDALNLYVGKRKTSSIKLNQIINVEKSAFNSRLIGWGIGNAGLCNRFHNGLCLTVRGITTYHLYISPGDTDTFLAHLKDVLR